MRLPAAVLAFALSAGGAMAQDEPGIRWGAVLDLRAAFVLVTGAVGRHRLSGRYDWFEVVDRDQTADANAEDGRGWTIAYLVRWNDAARVAVEWLQVTSTRASRADLDLAPRARETQLQASLRLTF